MENYADFWLLRGTGNVSFMHMQQTWRAMTAYLVSSVYPPSKSRLTSSDRLYQVVEREAGNIRDALAPLRSRRQGSEDRENDVLRELVARAALFGMRMFSQRKPTECFWTKKDETFSGVRQKSTQPSTTDGRSWVVIREPSN